MLTLSIEQLNQRRIQLESYFQQLSQARVLWVPALSFPSFPSLGLEADCPLLGSAACSLIASPGTQPSMSCRQQSLSG